jgi:hypothetical protein
MKKFLLSIILILGGTCTYAQQAQDYFPSQTGYRWDYKVIPLDSMNNEVDSMAYFRIDSFAVTTNFMGKDADLVLSKTGSLGIINFLPFTDSSFFSFENTDGYQYFRISNLQSLVGVLDSIGLDSTFFGLIQSFEDWYSVFRFNQSVNNEYTIFTKDTTISLNGINLPLRFEYLGKRLNDETIQTETGTYTCKKFLLSIVVSYIVFPPIVVELFRLETTKWIAQNVWLVKEYSPSTNVDLSSLTLGSFTIPGSKTELIPMITDVKNSKPLLADFSLDQNYPNPFNPETKINFRIPESGNVTLKVYNVLGKEVAALINEEKNSGSYTLSFNPAKENLASGVYIYVLKFKGMQISHKLVFLK